MQYVWKPEDQAAHRILHDLIDQSGKSYRTIAQQTGLEISHVRIGDIHNGDKAPVRLSEFIAICDVCHADPVATLREIIELARQIEEDSRRAEIVDAIAADPEAFGVAANKDKNKRLEAETPRD